MYPYNRITNQIFVKPDEFAVPRLVVIDGCNIAGSSCAQRGRNINCGSLMAMIRFLVVRDFEVVAFMPTCYNNMFNSNVSNAHVLSKLHELNVVTFTSARAAYADRPAFINYDDLYVLELAERHGGCVLSKDRFHDIAINRHYSNYRPIISGRRIDVIFHSLDSTLVYYGNDRFFGFLPELCVTDDVDKKLPMKHHLQRRLYCLPGDENYNKVVSRRRQWTAVRREKIVRTIDALFDEIALKNGLIARTVPIPEPKISKKIQDSSKNDNNEASTSRRYDLIDKLDLEELAKRWLSPPVENNAVVTSDAEPSNDPKSEKTTEENPQTVQEDILMPSTSGLDKQRQGVLDDPESASVIESLAPVFGYELVVEVLQENDTRDIIILANLCAERSLQND